jgi:hypothetical protein
MRCIRQRRCTSSIVVVAPSQDPFSCAIASVVDDEDGGVVGGEEEQGFEERPPVAPNWLRGSSVSRRKPRRVRVQALAGVRRWNRAPRRKN